MLTLLAGAAVGQDLSAATERLFEAAHEGDLSQAQISIAGGGDIHAVNDWGLTPVDLAADRGHFHVVHYLLQVRDIQDQKQQQKDKAAPAPMTAPTPAPSAVQPPPPAAPARTVYQAPLSEPAPPPASPPPGGPSPFDAGTPLASPVLPIIGNVRGPSAVDQAKNETVRAVVAEEARKGETVPGTEPVTAKPVATDEGEGFWNYMRDFIMPGTDQPVERPAAPVEVAETPAAPRQEPPSPPESVARARPAEKPGLFNRMVSVFKPKVKPEIKPEDIPVKAEVKPPVVLKKASPSKEETDFLDRMMAVFTGGKDGETPLDEPAPVAETKTEPTGGEPPLVLEKVLPDLPAAPAEADKGLLNKIMSVFSPDAEQRASTAPSKAAPRKAPEQEARQAMLVPGPSPKKAVRVNPGNNRLEAVLSVGSDSSLGKQPPENSSAGRFDVNCIDKKAGTVLFCIEKLNWPAEIEPHFIGDSIMYTGARTIVRYDDGRASYYHTVFPSGSFSTIVNYFTRRYGEPTGMLNRNVAPLGQPRSPNPTVLWQGVGPETDLLTTLEIRMYDDNRGSFPDTKRGGVYLYHEKSKSIFPQISVTELMLLRAKE